MELLRLELVQLTSYILFGCSRHYRYHKSRSREVFFFIRKWKVRFTIFTPERMNFFGNMIITTTFLVLKFPYIIRISLRGPAIDLQQECWSTQYDHGRRLYCFFLTGSRMFHVVYQWEKFGKKQCNNKFLILNVVSWQWQGYFMMLASGRWQDWRVHLIISWNVLCWHRLVVNSQFCGSYNIKNLIHFSFSQKNLISKTWYFLGFFQKTWYLKKS